MHSQASFGRRDGVCVFALRGAIRYPQARALRRFVDEVVLPADCDTVFLDLSSVEAIDSTGMGLLARIGRATLERHGRRAVLVRPSREVLPGLLAASFDVLFHLTEELPFDPQLELHDVPLAAEAGPSLALVMRDAHQALAELAEKNRAAFAEVLTALEDEVHRRQP
jgi:anti-anti-sigma factor